MRTLLVTGGAGFIGSNFVEYVLSKHRGMKCIVLDNLQYPGNIHNVKPFIGDKNYAFVKGDIRDYRQVLSLVEKSDIVVHFAAESHVDRSYVQSFRFASVNVLGTVTLLEAVRKYPVEKFIHLSTPEVFGNVGKTKITEDSPLRPMSPYAASKAGADRMCYAYHVAYGLPVVILKPSNNYGPRQCPEKLMSLFVTNAIENKPLPVYGKGLGVRDWLFTKDCCKAIYRAVEQPISKIKGEEIILATGETFTTIAIAKMILKRLSKPFSLIQYVQERPGHVEKFVFNSRKAERLLGWKPQVCFKDGFERTVQWFIENEPWWRKMKLRKEFIRFYKNWYGAMGLLNT